MGPADVDRVAALSALVLLGSTVSCSEPSRAEPPHRAEPDGGAAPVRPSLAVEPPGALVHEARERHRHDGETYLLHRFRIPLDLVQIDVVDMEMRRDLGAVLEERRAALVINGGYYGTDSRPEGLVIVGDRTLSPLLARIGGGVVTIARGRAEQRAAADFRPAPGIELAIQCSPALVVRGGAAIARHGEQTASRTALCIRDGGRGLDVYVANVEPSRGRAGPTLYTFSRELQAEGCEEALNLDGGPSSGFAWRGPQGVITEPPRRGIRHAVVFTIAD
ncbi:MAG: phosphodiester glycosidase family protein [Deltaproteobacteria bacterium]|nr:phosphodiester glycosidase family protein [Deltaproteobacteria bacterium]